MSKFDDFLREITRGANLLANRTFKRGRDEAKKIIKGHLDNSEERLKRWARLLANGELSEDEFKLLVNNQVTLGRMRLRTIRVIGKKAALQFRDNLRSLILDAAKAAFL
ncbi:MAG: hypothetical protein AAF438_05280 [Pseudomonadota bacterium]